MVPIGNRPILWHIMKTYAHYGHKEFILCLGYKGEMIKDYFRNYLWNTCDTTMMLGRTPAVQFHNRHDEEDWSVTLADTGENSMTAYRIRQVEKYLGKDEEFLLTYGDGVGSIDIPASIEQHRRSGKVCTLAAVHPPGVSANSASMPTARFTASTRSPRPKAATSTAATWSATASCSNTSPTIPA